MLCLGAAFIKAGPAERFIDFQALSRAHTSSGEELPSKLEPAEFPLQSEIHWVTASMVVGSLKICGFKQIAEKCGLQVFKKKMMVLRCFRWTAEVKMRRDTRKAVS